MIHHWGRSLAAAQRAADLAAVALAFLLAYYLRFEVQIIRLRDPHPGFAPYATLLAMALAIWALILQVGAAGRPRGYRNFGEEIGALLKLHALGVLVLLTLTFFLRSYSYSRIMMLLFALLSSGALVAERALGRRLLRVLARRGFGLRRVLLVGTGDGARQVLKQFQRHPEIGFRFTGVLAATPEAASRRVRRVPVLGTYEDARRAAAEVDLVILALPAEDQGRLPEIIDRLDDAMVDVWVVPDFVRHVRLRGGVGELEGLPLISLAASPLAGWNRLLKRGTDVLMAALGLALAAPGIALIAAAVRLSSRGPIFYRQERMGLDGRRFQILKFRTMVAQAEPGGARFAVERDPRVTRVGRLLRKTSLDEVPQLWNVLRGEMSLVGPRPERPVFIEDFRRHFPRYMLRHRVKAGMTGLAQVNGLRGNTSLKKRLEQDLFYIEHWSLWLDLKILWMTIPAVLRGKGAV